MFQQGLVCRREWRMRLSWQSRNGDLKPQLKYMMFEV